MTTARGADISGRTFRKHAGLDDLKYVLALEKRIAAAKKARKAVAQVRAAEVLLGKIADSIIDNWTAYTQGGETFPAAAPPAKAK